jgi:hypothetical protein
MQRWRYVHASYDGVVLESDADWSDGPAQGALGPFLNQAGAKGWELCGVLPYPTKDETGTALATPALAMIFKRPVHD